SIFYGSSITIEKYSTAPAFNIFLKGPTQAVNMFNENIPNLMEQLKAAKLNVGRLEAEHEKFTFRRKPKTGKKDSGSQK
nr:hypothetical protein [Candidatus Anoxychlamydiales bacterium]